MEDARGFNQITVTLRAAGIFVQLPEVVDIAHNQRSCFVMAITVFAKFSDTRCWSHSLSKGVFCARFVMSGARPSGKNAAGESQPVRHCACCLDCRIAPETKYNVLALGETQPARSRPFGPRQGDVDRRVSPISLRRKRVAEDFKRLRNSGPRCGATLHPGSQRYRYFRFGNVPVSTSLAEAS